MMNHLGAALRDAVRKGTTIGNETIKSLGIAQDALSKVRVGLNVVGKNVRQIMSRLMDLNVESHELSQLQESFARSEGERTHLEAALQRLQLSFVQSDASGAELQRQDSPMSPKTQSSLQRSPMAQGPVAAFPVPYPTGVVTVCTTDISGSHMLWNYEMVHMQRAMDQCNAQVRALLPEHGGYEVRMRGDGFVLAFQECRQCLRWAATMQYALLDIGWPPEILEFIETQEQKDPTGCTLFKGLRMMIGLNAGHATVETHPLTGAVEYSGPLVALTMQLVKCAKGGEICIGRSAFELLRLTERGFDGFVVQNIGEKVMNRALGSEVVHVLWPEGLAARAAQRRAQDPGDGSRANAGAGEGGEGVVEQRFGDVTKLDRLLSETEARLDDTRQALESALATVDQQETAIAGLNAKVAKATSERRQAQAAHEAHRQRTQDRVQRLEETIMELKMNLVLQEAEIQRSKSCFRTASTVLDGLESPSAGGSRCASRFSFVSSRREQVGDVLDEGARAPSKRLSIPRALKQQRRSAALSDGGLSSAGDASRPASGSDTDQTSTASGAVRDEPATTGAPPEAAEAGQGTAVDPPGATGPHYDTGLPRPRPQPDMASLRPSAAGPPQDLTVPTIAVEGEQVSVEDLPGSADQRLSIQIPDPEPAVANLRNGSLPLTPPIDNALQKASRWPETPKAAADSGRQVSTNATPEPGLEDAAACGATGTPHAKPEAPGDTRSLRSGSSGSLRSGSPKSGREGAELDSTGYPAALTDLSYSDLGNVPRGAPVFVKKAKHGLHRSKFPSAYGV